MGRSVGYWGVFVALVGCGARSGLLEPFQADVSAAGTSAGGSAGTTFGGKGGSVGPGGTFSVGGKLGGAGTPAVSGSAGVGGTGQAGEPSTCQLAVGDCATAAEPDCSGERVACSGQVASYERLDSSQSAFVEDVAAGRDGRIVISGTHYGVTTFGDEVLTSPQGMQAYVASFSPRGVLEWVYGDPFEGGAYGSHLELALSGEAVLQTSHEGSSLVRLSTQGAELDRVDWETLPAAVEALAVDNDDRIWSAGFFEGSLGYPGTSLETSGSRSGYLLSVDARLAAQRELAVTSPGSVSSSATALAVDDEDQLLVVGYGDSGSTQFFRKLRPDGTLVFQKDIDSDLGLIAVVVDRLMRITLVGNFWADFENEGVRFTTNDLSPWVGQYSREGELLWQKSYDGASRVMGAAVDPYGNIVVIGDGSRLTVGARELRPEHPGLDSEFAWVLKLRPDGTDVWARAASGPARWVAVACDNAGQVWLAGSFHHTTWLDDHELSSPSTSGLLVRLNP